MPAPTAVWKRLVSAFMIQTSQRSLSEVVLALSSPRGFARGLNRRQQKRDENSNNGNDHQKLDESERELGSKQLMCSAPPHDITSNIIRAPKYRWHEQQLVRFLSGRSYLCFDGVAKRRTAKPIGFLDQASRPRPLILNEFGDETLPNFALALRQLSASAVKSATWSRRSVRRSAGADK
jgi:hypothetical protein